MATFPRIEDFVQVHRSCGELSWVAEPPTPIGYRLRIACSCGIILDRRVTLEAAEDDLLRTRLTAFLN